MAADFLTRELKTAAICLAAKKDDIRARVVHLRLHALPQLLFRVPYRHFPQSSDEPSVGRGPRWPTACGKNKTRLLMAFREEWPNLVADLMPDIQREAAEPLRFPTPPGAHYWVEDTGQAVGSRSQQGEAWRHALGKG